MRMWNVDTTKMCRQHLLGEHLEMHMFKGNIEKGKNIFGYIQNDLVVLGNIKNRHDKLVKEMKRRGYNHKTPMEKFNEGRGGAIITKKNVKELKKRCKRCQF